MTPQKTFAQSTTPVRDTSVPSSSELRSRLRLAEFSGHKELSFSPALEAMQRFDSLGPGSLRITLERAIQNSLDLASVRARSQAQQAQVDVASGALRPRLDVRIGHGQEMVRPGVEVNPETRKLASYSDYPRTDSSVVLRQSVHDLGLRFERDRQQALAASTEASALGSKQQVILDAAAAHFDVLQYRLMLEFAREYQYELDQLLQHVESRVQAGGASAAEADRVNSRSISARASAIEASGLLGSALLSYGRLVGALPQSLPTDDILVLGDVPTIEQALPEAFEKNAGLVASREQERALKFEGKVAQSRMLPKFDLEVGNYQGVSSLGGASRTNESRAMLVMSWNVLNGGSDRAQDRAAMARLTEAQFRTKDLERRIEESLRIAYNTLDALAQRVSAIRQEWASNQRVAEAFRTQLRSGNRSILDVLDAEQRVYQSRVEALRLTVTQANLTMQLLQKIGRLDVPSSLADISNTPSSLDTPVRRSRRDAGSGRSSAIDVSQPGHTEALKPGAQSSSESSGTTSYRPELDPSAISGRGVPLVDKRDVDLPRSDFPEVRETPGGGPSLLDAPAQDETPAQETHPAASKEGMMLWPKDPGALGAAPPADAMDSVRSESARDFKDGLNDEVYFERRAFDSSYDAEAESAAQSRTEWGQAVTPPGEHHGIR